MVYRLTSMSRKTKLTFFCLIWIFSAIFTLIGTSFITTAVILPNTPYDIRESDIIIDIRQEMGPWRSLNYFDHELAIGYPDVRVREEDGTINAYDENQNLIDPFHIWQLEEMHENGSIYFLPESGVLVLDLWNGTVFEVEAKPEDLRVDIGRKMITLKYQARERFEVLSRVFILPEDEPLIEEGKQVHKQIGYYFDVTNRGWISWFQQIIVAVRDNFWWGFAEVGQKLLLTVAIGGGIGILTAFILIITRLSKALGGKYLTYLILRALNGKFGRILNIIPIFDFNGDFYVEERFVDVIDFSKVRSTFVELYKQRWYDILVFPTALASIVTIFFVQNHEAFNPIFSILKLSIDNKMEALALSPLLTPIILFIILLYYPMIWAFNEGGFKRLQISPQGDIIAVKPLGKILRDGLGILIGFSGILSLGALAVEVTESLAQQPTSTGQIQVAGFTLDLFGLVLLLLWTLGLFFILLGSIVVGASVLAVSYLHSAHLETIEYLRLKSEKKGVITNWGSIFHQFSPVAKEAIFEKIKN